MDGRGGREGECAMVLNKRATGMGWMVMKRGGPAAEVPVDEIPL